MSLFQTITADDLEPEGMLCEACQLPFEVGDEYVASVVAYSDLTIGEVADRFDCEVSDDVDPGEHVPIIGEFRCRACFEAGREVAE